MLWFTFSKYMETISFAHLPNPFNVDHTNFSASDLDKGKPGQWIPVYYSKDIPEYFRKKNLMPVRAGQAEFFLAQFALNVEKVL